MSTAATIPDPHRLRTLYANVFLIVVSIAGLFAFDFALEKTERNEIHGEADSLYNEGALALKQGRPKDAVEKLRRAYALERGSRDYEMLLAEGLIAENNYPEAKTLITDLLQQDPNNGRANLIAARLMTETGHFEEAESYYHRAIYGTWADNAAAHRVRARLELIHALDARGYDADLLPELLPLETEAAGQPEILKEIARLYLKAGAPTRAAEIYNELLVQNPNDPALFEGLGRAELERGDYRAAQTAFLSAFKYAANKAAVRPELELSSSLYALDPTPRRLRSAEKLSRSVRILSLAREQADSCLNQLPLTAPGADQLRALLDDTDEAENPKAPVTNEEAEAKLSEAQKIWTTERKLCTPGKSLQANELSLIMRKLTMPDSGEAAGMASR